MSHLWVRRPRILENTQEAIIVPGSRVEGMFKIEGMLPDGRRRLIADWFPNIITNGGLERWGTGAPIGYCAVGSGNATPAATDTTLQTFVAQGNGAISITLSKILTSPYYGYGRATFQFNPPGSAHTLAEIGVGWGASGTNLWSRSLIKNDSGVPTAITWGASETLYIYYETRCYPWLTPVSYSASISGVAYTGTIQLEYAGLEDAGKFINAAMDMGYQTLTYAYSGDMGATITDVPGGTATFRTGGSTDAYVAGSYKRTGTAIWGPTAANYADGIKSLGYQANPHYYQMSFSPAIPKVADYTLSLNLESGSWGRY